jgi:hypothetical protein
MMRTVGSDATGRRWQLIGGWPHNDEGDERMQATIGGALYVLSSSIPTDPERWVVPWAHGQRRGCLVFRPEAEILAARGRLRRLAITRILLAVGAVLAGWMLSRMVP